MTRISASLLAATSVLVCSSASFAFEAPQLSAAELASLQNGDAIISVWKDREREHKPTISKGGIDINVPADTIYAIMLDCGRMSEVSSDIRACDVLETSQDGSWDIRKQKFAVSPVLPKFNATFKTFYTRGSDDSRIMQIEKISGDLKVQEGRWDIIPLSDHTSRVIYQTALKPSLPIPAKIIRKQVAIGIPEILRNLRDVAVSDFAASQAAPVKTVSVPDKDIM